MTPKLPNLVRHHLAHVPEMRVHDSILDRRFASDCATHRCQADCCQGGVWVDMGERDTIVANAERIRQHMDPGQETDPARWFDGDEDDDDDFPSGRAVGTQVNDRGCVFLDDARLCVLQKASSPALQLKPFYCRAYPITVENRELLLDEGCASRCCDPVPDGIASVLDVCAGELRDVLGPAGFAELERIAAHEGAPAEPPDGGGPAPDGRTDA